MRNSEAETQKSRAKSMTIELFISSMCAQSCISLVPQFSKQMSHWNVLFICLPSLKLTDGAVQEIGYKKNTCKKTCDVYHFVGSNVTIYHYSIVWLAKPLAGKTCSCRMSE